MVLGGLVADVERGGDLLVGEAAGEEPQHLGLSWGETEVGGCARGGIGREQDPRALGQSRDLAGQRLVLDRHGPMRSLAERGLRTVAD